MKSRTMRWEVSEELNPELGEVLQYYSKLSRYSHIICRVRESSENQTRSAEYLRKSGKNNASSQV
jgi:hypothetical protein